MGRPDLVATALTLLAVLFCGALFGFFLAWDVSTIHGLDRITSGIAIQAMQAMNASVRNPGFAVIYFGTPVVLLLALGALWWRGSRGAAALMAAAFALVAGGVLLLTAVVNVPMNQALAAAGLPADPQAQAALWAGYSPRWQNANHIRSLASGFALLLAALALHSAARGAPR